MVNIDVDLVASTKGFLEPEEGEALYQYAVKAANIGPCLEIGSYCGKSTVYLGVACKAKGTVLFSVDHHRGSEEQQPGEEYFDPELLDDRTGGIDTFHLFRDTLALADLEDTVVPLVCKSDLAAKTWATPLSLVFIDGGHSFHSVYTDYCVWSSQLMAGGFLLFHDIFTDPNKGGQAPFITYGIAVSSGLFRELPMVGTLGVLQRMASE